MNTKTPITDAAASTSMFIDGEPVVVRSVVRKLELKLNEAVADAAVMREALEALHNREAFRSSPDTRWEHPIMVACRAAISTNAGREMLAEVERLRDENRKLAIKAGSYTLPPHIAAELESLRNMAANLTYHSAQSTACAGCGKVKHTPLRRDEMGGYVCLACIDKELTALRRKVEAAKEMEMAVLEYLSWHGAQHDSGCPEDDTCECVRVRRLEAALSKWQEANNQPL